MHYKEHDRRQLRN